MFRKNKDLAKYAVEFVGTLFFISVILLSKGNALMVGLALAVAILFGGKISGGHFNPAVSFTMFMKKSITMRQLMFYVLAQALGGFTSIRVVKMLA